MGCSTQVQVRSKAVFEAKDPVHDRTTVGVVLRVLDGTP